MAGEQLVTGKSLKYLKVPFRLSRWFHFHPFKWEEIIMTGHRRSLTSHFARRHWHLNVVLNVVHFLFVQFRCIQVNLHPEYSIVLRVYMGYVTVCYFSFTMTHLNYVRKRDEIAGFIRSYLAFLEQSQGGSLEVKLIVFWNN